MEAGSVEGLLELERNSLLVIHLYQIQGLLIFLGVKEILSFCYDPLVVFRVEEAEQIDVGHCQRFLQPRLYPLVVEGMLNYVQELFVVGHDILVGEGSSLDDALEVLG